LPDERALLCPAHRQPRRRSPGDRLGRTAGAALPLLGGDCRNVMSERHTGMNHRRSGEAGASFALIVGQNFARAAELSVASQASSSHASALLVDHRATPRLSSRLSRIGH
jgi:hypothetical protein